MTAQTVIDVARSYIGANERDGSFKKIIDIYNRNNPPVHMLYAWEWCATFISTVFILAKGVELIGGIECGVQRFIQIFKDKGIWEEDGRIRPKPGYIICYNWDDGTQPNDGWADHIGLVEKVSGNRITVIEGNMSGGKVGRRSIPVAYGYIRGYAIPAYGKEDGKEKDENEVDVTYRSYIKELSWLERVTNVEGKGHDNYSGVYGYAISALQIEAASGKIRYRMHEKNGDWLDWQNGSMKNSSGDTYAGDKKSSYDGLQIESTAGDVEYAVNTAEDGWLSYVTNYGDGDEGYAGVYGHAIQGVRIRAIKKKVK